jgi:hypothetical protein
MTIPPGWTNPITVSARSNQLDVDPTRLLPSRPDLDQKRIEVQRLLIRSGQLRWTPIRVTKGGIIFDGHHMVRAAAEEGTLVDVVVVANAEVPIGVGILDLPVR